MSGKTAHQILSQDGKAAAPASSAPGWHLGSGSEDIQVAGAGRIEWGPLFSTMQAGNQVEFFVSGEEYFAKVARAISQAKSSVFITGWQVNYDVQLTPQQTLFACLQAALKGGANIYVMPWLSPKAGVDTGDFETMLAVFQLNAGASTTQAFCLPAMQQGDQNTLGAFFSHHQKLVVVDNQYAFVGGIDLAYGRRDDGRFSLKADWRALNELYNSCVPAIHPLSNVDQKDCLTRAELLAATLVNQDGWLATRSTFLTSPAESLAPAWDALDSIKEGVSDAKQGLSDWCNEALHIEFVDALKNQLQDQAVDAAQAGLKWAWHGLNPTLRRKLERLRENGSANAQSAVAAIVGWLNNASLDQLPPDLIAPVSRAIEALSFGLIAHLGQSANQNTVRYQRLFDKVKIVPKSGAIIDIEQQPRMPWHDVHAMIEGPSVFDLANNFTRRWNASARHYEASFSRYRDPIASLLLKTFAIKLPPSPKAPRIAQKNLPLRSGSTATGKCRVQVLRSAPKTLRAQEARALSESPVPTQVQNNCLKAMLKAIEGAQKFIYIEGQFFQSAFGADSTEQNQPSGPLGALMDVRQLPDYERFSDMLGLRNVPAEEIPKRIRWNKVDNVLALAQGKAFMADLKAILTNVTTVRALNLLKTPQKYLINPIGSALAQRIGRNIRHGLPFHVYLVLPVHPEGPLNVLNIMTQTHLTMQSLVFGQNSLVNQVRRQILAMRWAKEKKIRFDAAEQQIAALTPQRIIGDVGDDWQQYLTLLNLRNWDVLGGKPVTEKIYVHSKLLIADDRVAILGSANINDRSQLGDRDSELAVIVTDDTQHSVKLDGRSEDKVSAKVHDLRRRLWQKLFGLHSSGRQAPSLLNDAILDQPAAPATWRAIQQVAKDNADTYESAFWYIPRSGARPEIQAKDPDDKEDGPPPASIWPTWNYDKYVDPRNRRGRLRYRMPFDELFWRQARARDVVSTWNVAKEVQQDEAPVSQPEAIQGFITALPLRWTYRENNNSGMNLSILAHSEQASPPGSTPTVLAEAKQPDPHNEERA